MPWGRLDDSLYDHPKLDRLEDAERLAAVGLWALAISWSNRFLTDGHIPRGRIERLGGTIALADALVGAELFDASSTGYEIHDFLEFNDSRADVIARREYEAQRKAEWRKRKRPGGTDDGTPEASTHDVPSGVPVGQADTKASDVPPSVPVSVPRDSRARGRSANPGPSRPVPAESLKRGSSRANGRADITALHDRGWKRVTAAQRAVLDEIAGRHDLTGHAFAAEAIRSTGPDDDPLEAAMAADRQWQEAQRRRSDGEDLDWKATKEQERREAGERLGDLAEATEAWR
jgi:hypothetical protein